MMRSIRQSDFMKSVLVLMTGTVIAQVLGYMIYPLLTRIYTSEQFGEMYLYMRVVALISAVATVRYELTLPIAKRDLHAFHLYRLSFRISLVVLTAVAIVGVFYLIFRPEEGVNTWFLLLTLLSAYLSVWVNLGTNWSVRMKDFSRISRQRIIQSVASNGLKLVFGWFSWGGIGLIFAMFLGYLGSAYVFVVDFVRIRKQHRGYKTRKRMRILSREYRDFPLLNLPHVLIDLGVDLALASLILGRFGKEDFGFYSHAFAILKLPLGIIGQSFGQVFMNRCSEMVNKGQSIVSLVKKTTGILFLLSLIPFTILFFFGEPLFAFVFGKEWGVSGTYAAIMAPWLMLNFILSPVSGMPLVLGRQKEVFLIGLTSAFGQLFIFGVIPYLLPSDQITMSFLLWCATGFQVVLLLLVLVLYIRFAKMGRRGG